MNYDLNSFIYLNKRRENKNLCNSMDVVYAYDRFNYSEEFLCFCPFMDLDYIYDWFNYSEEFPCFCPFVDLDKILKEN